MARYTTISTIGAPAPSLPTDASTSHLIAHMCNFWQEKIEQVLPDRPDLILLPEFCDVYAHHSIAQQREYLSLAGDTLLEFFQGVARANNCYIVHPTLCVSENGCHNRTRILDRDGQVMGAYDKYHPTIREMEELDIACGDEAPIIECDFGRIACLTCFDLNFDELRLKYVEANPDLLLFSSLYHGGLMQTYWAYSCRAHFVSAIGFSGLRSSILSPLGTTLAETTIYHDFVTAHVNLDCVLVHLDGNRDKLKSLKKKYGPAVHVMDPDLLGSVFITSESTETTAQDMVHEFTIELLDDYLSRSVLCQQRNRKARGSGAPTL